MINLLKRHITFLLLFTLTSSSMTAQENVDSLETLLKSDIHDTTKLNVLFELSSILGTINYDKSLIYGTQLLVLSQKLENKTKSAQAYALLGTTHFYLNSDSDTILNLSEQGLAIIEGTNQPIIEVDLLRNRALAYQKAGQLDKAFAIFKEALQLSEKEKLEGRIIRSLSNMALIPYYQKDYETAKNYFTRGLSYAQKVNHQEYIALTSNNLAEIYKKLNQLDSALFYYNTSLELNKKLDNLPRIAMTTSNIGNTYALQKKYKSANIYLQKGYNIAKKNNYNRVLSINLYYLTESYFDQNKHLTSIQYGEEGLKVLGENGHVTRRVEYYELLSLNHEAIGNYKASLAYRKQFQILNDSLFNLDKSEQIKSLELQYEVGKKETENQLLKANQENAQKTIRNQTFAAIGLILALVFAIGWGSFVYRGNQQRRRLNKILEVKINQRTSALQNANKNLEKVNNELRTFNYIASHDIKEPIRNIGSYVGLISRKLPDDLKQNLQPYFDTIKTSTKQLYTLIEDFARYSSLSKDEKVELESVDLSLLVDNLKDTLKAKIAKCNGQVTHHDLPKIESNNSFLFTTLKNLIENGLKYNESKVPTIEITYQQRNNNHQIIVSDNGIGIDKEYHKKVFEMFKRLHHRGIYEGSGLGLAIVQLSLEKINGTIHLESELGKGSQFIVMIPIVKGIS